MITFTREDYEMAAKAAGLRIKWIGDVAHDCTKLKPDAPAFKGPMWNPPEDDGDALRLAVKLNLIVGTYDTYASVCHTMIIGGESDTPDEEVVWFHSTGGDPYAATRRAIFRAAIAIGRAMP